jgi:hypothetical protein
LRAFAQKFSNPSRLAVFAEQRAAKPLGFFAFADRYRKGSDVFVFADQFSIFADTANQL